MSQTKPKKDVLAGRSPEMQLYRAARRYVEAASGKIVVIGGIEVQEWPDEATSFGGMGRYRIAVRFTGRKPVFPNAVGTP